MFAHEGCGMVNCANVVSGAQAHHRSSVGIFDFIVHDHERLPVTLIVTYSSCR